MDGTITTTPPPTSVTDGENEYLPDPWGRFLLPGPLAASLLATGNWHYWTEADAPALGEWVDMGLPTLTEAEADDLFPCFVNLYDQDPENSVPGFRYRTVGASQIEFDGAAWYVVGTNLPTDFGTPASYTTVCPFPDTIHLATPLALLPRGYNPSSGAPCLVSIGSYGGNLFVIGPDDETFPLLPAVGIAGTLDAVSPAAT